LYGEVLEKVRNDIISSGSQQRKSWVDYKRASIAIFKYPGAWE